MQPGHRLRGLCGRRDRRDKVHVSSREYSHLILLCENNTGYQNLMYLVLPGLPRRAFITSRAWTTS